MDNAVLVAATLGKGTSDRRIAEFVRTENRLLVTTDRDFLDPELHADIRILLVADDSAAGDEIAERATELARLADTPNDLERVTWV